MKIHTCALMPFPANEAFFTRDTGLLCRSFRSLGLESSVILPTRENNDPKDPAEIIRATPEEFTSPAWWRALEIDAVVFITWGFREHTPVIRAACEAGIRTCAIFETAGNSFPYSGILPMVRTFWQKGRFSESLPKRLLGTLARTVYFAVGGIFSNYHRSVQIGIPHVSAFDTPSAMARCLDTAGFFPWIPWQSQPVLLGYPIPDFFAPRARDERRVNVVAIARWDAIRHKRPQMLMHMTERLLKAHPTVTVEVFGRLIPDLEQWHAGLGDGFRDRVRLPGIQPSTVIADAIGTSQVLYCPSVSDGIPLVVIEGLCGGCSVAGLKTLDVPGLHWAVAEGDGSFAEKDSPAAHAGAVLEELAAWQQNRRDPLAISGKWKNWFSADAVAERSIQLLFPPLAN